MTFSVNQKINSYPQSYTGLSDSQLQQIEAEKIKQGIANNTVVKNFNDKEEKNKHLDKILLLPLWFVMARSMGLFNTLCAGKYEESLIGRIGDLCESIGEKVPFLDKIGKPVDSFKETLKTKIVNKSKILSAAFNTPTMPENSGAKMMYGGTKVEIASDAIQRVLEKITEDGKTNLDKFGISLTEFEELKKHPHKPENIKKLIEIFEKQGPNAYCEIPWEIPMTGIKLNKIHPKAVNKFYYSSYANKLRAFENGNKTFIGKKLPGTMLRVIEGITNGTAGGKFAVFMAAMFIAGSIKDAINAPKGDKVSTFAESNVNGIGFYMLMPFCIGLLHKFGGLKYIGMSKEKVENYRKALEEFNKKAVSGSFVNKAEYNTAKNELKDMLKGDAKILKTDAFGTKMTKWFKDALNKPLRRAAKIVTVGIEVPKPFSAVAIEKGEKFWKTKFPRIINGEKWYTLQKGLGFLRFPLIAFAISPPFINLATRASHLVFGRPAKSLLDKEEEKPKAA